MVVGAYDCALACVESCQPFYYGEPGAYGRCLSDCQASCPGGAPLYTGPIWGDQDLCIGTAGLIRCTARGVAEDLAELPSRAADAATRALAEPTVLLALAVVAAAVVFARRL